MKPSLLVLAAGMGSRYGSLKQMDGLGPNGETIIDYSVYDAIRSGFGKVVFVIRHSFEDDFKKIYSSGRFGGAIQVEYVFQELDSLPAGYKVPEGREKPWGTNHALLMAAPVINGPFAVINGDDFYGRDSFAAMARFLENVVGEKGHYSMIGYKIENTLSDFGGVSRGVCSSDGDGYLKSINERFQIARRDGVISHIKEDRQEPIAEGTPVSMNFWGFTPDYFAHSERLFRQFLDTPATMANPKSEFFIPYVADDLISAGAADFKILGSDAKWFGVTYQEDRPYVVERIAALVAAGEYPADLWGMAK